MSLPVSTSAPRFWERLPGNVQGAAWLGLYAAVNALMLMAAKGLGGEIGAFQILLVRAIASLVLVAGLIPRLTWSALAPRRPLLLFMRSAIATVSLGLLYYSVAHIPLADAQALSFSGVIFLVPLSVLLLREQVGVHRWAAAGIGFLGVLIVLRPTGAGFERELLGALAGVASAAGYAGVLVTVRMISREMSADATYVWGIVGLAVMSAPLGLLDWTQPTGRQWVLLAVVAALGAFGQYASVRAYSVGEASAIAPMDYLKLVFAMLGGFLVFAEVPDLWTIFGALVIVAATAYTTWREARRRKLGAQGASAPTAPS